MDKDDKETTKDLTASILEKYNEDDTYRNLLQELEIKAQEQYDKTVLMLSSGALGISFSFIKDIVSIDKSTYTNFLIGSWTCWMLSVLFVLVSFYTSKEAMSIAIAEHDNGNEVDTNKFNLITHISNFLSGFFFVIGLIFIIVFINKNIGG